MARELDIFTLPDFPLKTIASALGNLAGFSAESRFHDVWTLGHVIEGMQNRIDAYHQDLVRENDGDLPYYTQEPDFTLTVIGGKWETTELGLEYNPVRVDPNMISRWRIAKEARRIQHNLRG